MSVWRTLGTIAFLAVVLLGSNHAHADLLCLVDGTFIEGVILRKTPQNLILRTPKGKRTFARSQVARILEGKIIYDIFLERKAVLDARDVEGFLRIASWVEGHGYRSLAGKVRRHVLSLDPENAEARKKLGHVRARDQWFSSPGKLRAAQGFVKVSGRWMAAKDFEKGRKGFVLFGREWFTRADMDILLRGGVVVFPDQGGFSVYRTRHYLLCAQKKLDGVQACAAFAEAALEGLKTQFSGSPPHLFPVVLFQNRKAFDEYLADHREPWIPLAGLPHGLFHPESRTVYLSFFHDWQVTRTVLLHELCHQFEWTVYPKAAPLPWYREGIACFLSQFGLLEGKVTLGLLNRSTNLHFLHLTKLFRSGRAWNLAQVLHPDPARLTDPHFYDHAWSLVYFLKRHASPSVRMAFRKWEKALHGKEATSLQAALGSNLAGLEREWRAFLREMARVR
jgi:hypothetical protein